MPGVGTMHTLLRDLRYALRQLFKTPGFTLTAVVSLALGIGATTAVFSVIYAILVNPYPYAAPDRMVHMRLKTPSGQDRYFGLTAGQWQEIRKSPVVEDAFLEDDWNLTVTGQDLPEDVNGVVLSSNAFNFLGVPAALALDRAQFPGKALFRRLVLLPLILPGVITGLSLLMLFHAAAMKLSLLTIVLGHGTALISVATTEVFAGLQKLDRAQEEASLDLGANYWQTFWRVTMPNLKLSIIGAALLIFTLSMDEIAVSFFLIGRDNTLPLEIWGRLRRGMTPEINAVSTIIFVFSLVAIVVWYRLRVRDGRTEAGMEVVEALGRTVS